PNGWVVAYDVDGSRKIGAWVSTPSSFGGGIWQASQGPAADENGNVYVMTGNGGYVKGPDGKLIDFEGKTDFAESFVKLRVTDSQGSQKLTAVDWFTPFKDSARAGAYRDQDLGAGAP